VDKSTRGIRGAVTVDGNHPDAIVGATRSLLESMVRQNRIEVEDVCTVIFSVTGDLDAEFPAIAARDIGWIYTPLLCTNEIPVPGALERCVRVLMLVNTGLKQDEIVHVYLGDAMQLRPDLNGPERDQYYRS
jgi:chorismate mutase